MAAYAASVTLDQRKPVQLAGNPGLKMVTGVVDVTNYNSTLAEITGITGLFKTVHRVVLNALSDNGYAGHWVPASGAVKCYIFDYSNASDGPALELGADVDAGAFSFVAYGT